jgi:hypothetical protein
MPLLITPRKRIAADDVVATPERCVPAVAKEPKSTKGCRIGCCRSLGARDKGSSGRVTIAHKGVTQIAPALRDSRVASGGRRG